MLELKDLTVSYDICILDHVYYIFPDIKNIVLFSGIIYIYILYIHCNKTKVIM